jgi:C1A family cysteine protease
MLPYEANPAEAPTPADDVAAQPFRLPQPVQVTIDPQDVKSVLTGKQAITIGFTVYDSFENTGADGIVPTPNPAAEKILGGHGVLVVGYDDANQWWIIRNQWGADWGANGYCFMRYGYEQYWTEAWTGAPTA